MTLDIPNLYFIIGIAIATAYLTFLTTKGGLTDNRFSHWKRLTKRGWLVLSVLLIITVLLGGQEWNSQIKNDRKEAEAEREDKERDSIITARVNSQTDSSRAKLFEDISIAFAKQELRLDTVKKNVERIKDSAKSVVNNYTQKDPYFTIDKISIDKKEDSLQNISIVYKNHFASATNFRIKMYANFIHNNGSETVSKLDFPLNYSDRTPEDVEITSKIIHYNSQPISIIHIYITGDYTNLEKNKPYKINEVFICESNVNNTSSLILDAKQKVIDNIKAAFQRKGIKM